MIFWLNITRSKHNKKDFFNLILTSTNAIFDIYSVAAYILNVLLQRFSKFGHIWVLGTEYWLSLVMTIRWIHILVNVYRSDIVSEVCYQTEHTQQDFSTIMNIQSVLSIYESELFVRDLHEITWNRMKTSLRAQHRHRDTQTFAPYCKEVYESQCWASYSKNVIYYSLLVTPFKSNIVTLLITFWQQ